MSKDSQTQRHDVQTPIVLAVAVGVLVGVGVALWILNRAAHRQNQPEDPDAPLFV